VRVVATAGHVDHGKSTLVRHLTGTDPDRLEEERRRGLTIDLGFAVAMLPSGAEVGFVDVPGHARFVKNMLAGVGAVDACLFVVAANEGWKPQSEEHLRILELVGISHGLVALTKVGTVDAEQLELVEMEIADQVVGTFLEDAEVVSVDAPAGIGLEGEQGLVSALERLVAATPPAPDLGRPRLFIDRAFSLPGPGTVVTGTLVGGRIGADERLVIEPGRHQARVRSLQSHGRTLSEAEPGRRLAVALSGVSHNDVRRGQALVRDGQWHLTSRLDASLQVLAGFGQAVTPKGSYVGHFGSGELPVRLFILGGRDDITPGSEGFVRLRLAATLPLLPGDRYVLRESGRAETVGGGEVLDVEPVLPVSRARPSRDVRRVVAERGFVEASELERLTGVRLEPDVAGFVADAEALAGALERLRRAVGEAGAAGLDPARLSELERALVGRCDDISVLDGRLVAAEVARSASPIEDHPYLAALRATPFSPPPPEGVDRLELRSLERHGLAVRCEGTWFAATAVGEAGRVLGRLLASSPEGVTTSEVREELGTSRRYALALLAHLDATGVTRRRGDVRVAGPKLPRPDRPADRPARAVPDG
jgi:selenocysteine-specific elongation factor